MAACSHPWGPGFHPYHCGGWGGERNIEVGCKFETESEISVGIHECLFLIDFPPVMDTAKLRDTEQPVENSNQFLEVGSMETSFDQEIAKQA